MNTDIAVIAIDGPSGAGKGSVAQALASQLGFHLLDSGAVYRAAALHLVRQSIDLKSPDSVLQSVLSMRARFEPGGAGQGVRVWLDEQDVSGELRTEATAAAASTVAVMLPVRRALLPQQRSFRRAPGLVADGRDMGTVVFPDAPLKIFLTASASERAQRRARQLQECGIDCNLAQLCRDIEQRDRRDSTREHSPLLAADDAITIDSSELTVEAVVRRIIVLLRQEIPVI